MTYFRDLIVWQKSLLLTKYIYEITNQFPSDQRYRLVDQMQRAAVSIMSNIAEGSKRSRNEYVHFLRIANGSAAELESQIILAKELNYINAHDANESDKILREITCILNTIIRKLQKQT